MKFRGFDSVVPASVSGLHLEKKLDLYHKPEKNPGDKLKKKSRCAGPENFLRFETDLDFLRP